jgi:hypothetical protein
MYTIKKSVLNQVLKRKFNSLVGNVCERIEIFSKNNNIDIDDIQVREVIFDVKKYCYDTMRDSEEQIDIFSNGVNINVKFERPDSSN